MYQPLRHLSRSAVLASALLNLVACGGSGSTTAPAPPPPPPAMYTVGGTISGVDSGQKVVLENNGGDDLTVSADGAFSFATKVASGGIYAVMAIVPLGKTCSVTGGSGAVTANVNSVVVACVNSPTFSIGGSVSGMAGQGLRLALLLPSRNGAHTVVDTVTINSNGKFVFPLQHAASPNYSLNIQQQPMAPVQRCVLGNSQVPYAEADILDLAVACQEFLFVTNAIAGSVSVFSVDAATGLIASVGPPVTTGQAPQATAGTTDKRFVYVVNRDSNDVAAFSVDPDSGALTQVPGSPFAAGTHPNAIALVPYLDGFRVYVANAGSKDLSLYQTDAATGVLTPSTPAIYPNGAELSVMDASPNGYELLTANASGSNDISAYDVTLGLRPLFSPPISSGGDVSSLAFGNGGGFFYVANASGASATISGFSYNTGASFAPSLPGFPLALPSCKFIVNDRSVNYLYAIAGTNIVGYSIDSTGALAPLAGFPIAIGATADSIAIDPSNQFLYVRSGAAGLVIGFRRDVTAGSLTPLSGSPFNVGSSADFLATL